MPTGTNAKKTIKIIGKNQKVKEIKGHRSRI